jgi:hypothetical protein
MKQPLSLLRLLFLCSAISGLCSCTKTEATAGGGRQPSPAIDRSTQQAAASRPVPNAEIVFELSESVPESSLLQFLIGDPAVVNASDTTFLGEMKFVPIEAGRATLRWNGGRYGIFFGAVRTKDRFRHVVGRSGAYMTIDLRAGDTAIVKLSFGSDWVDNPK